MSTLDRRAVIKGIGAGALVLPVAKVLGQDVQLPPGGGGTCGYGCLQPSYESYHNSIHVPNFKQILRRMQGWSGWSASADNAYLGGVHHKSLWYDVSDSLSDKQIYTNIKNNAYGVLSGAAPSASVVNSYIARCNYYGYYPSYSEAFNTLNRGTAAQRQQALQWVNSQTPGSVTAASHEAYKIAILLKRKMPAPNSYPDDTSVVGPPYQNCLGYDTVVGTLGIISFVTAFGGPLTIEIAVTTGLIGLTLGLCRPMVC